MFNNKSNVEKKRTHPMKLIAILFGLLVSGTVAQADLHLDPPAELLQRAAVDKNELRDVINEIDINLAEMRDQTVFDQYFFMLDDLQALAVKLDLDSIYPTAIKKLGNRMVQKGVNWLDIFKTSREHLLYYHRWMADYQTASSFLFAVELQIKDETDKTKLRVAAGNLEALMVFADQTWPDEKALRLLYRTTLSGLATKVLKNETPSDSESDFWLAKIYTSDAMSEVTTMLQSQVYALTLATVDRTPWIVRRLFLVYSHSIAPTFGATEGLTGQIGDTAVDLVLKTFRLDQRLSDQEFNELIGMMQTRHLIALAAGWATFGKVPRGSFADYYLQRAYDFIKILQTKGLGPEAVSLAQSIEKKSAAIQGHEHDLEGTWLMTDNVGTEWRLVLAYATEEMLIASFGDSEENYIRPLFNIVYDSKRQAFLASERPMDIDKSPNRAIRIFPLPDGSLRVLDLSSPLKPAMHARRVQKFPDVLAEGSATTPPDLDGVYRGQITIAGGTVTSVILTVTVFSGASIGNLQMLDGNYDSTLNFGTPADNGVIYLTHGNVVGSGTWMQLRAKLGSDGVLRGYTIYGGSGLVPRAFALKKVK
jgi:hypothetical protein